MERKPNCSARDARSSSLSWPTWGGQAGRPMAGIAVRTTTAVRRARRGAAVATRRGAGAAVRLATQLAAHCRRDQLGGSRGGGVQLLAQSWGTGCVPPATNWAPGGEPRCSGSGRHRLPHRATCISPLAARRRGAPHTAQSAATAAGGATHLHRQHSRRFARETCWEVAPCAAREERGSPGAGVLTMQARQITQHHRTSPSRFASTLGAAGKGSRRPCLITGIRKANSAGGLARTGCRHRLEAPASGRHAPAPPPPPPKGGLASVGPARSPTSTVVSCISVGYVTRV